MKRLPVTVAILIAVVAVTAATVVGVVLASRDANPRMGTGPMMMDTVTATGEPEYLAGMVAHHQEAVVAARELARSDRPQMRALGQSIVDTQTAQIEQMTDWLAEWYPEQPAAVEYRPMMRDLSDLSGDSLDQAFLQDMIGHHMAAVMMSQHLLRRGADHEDVAQLATTIRDDQHTEIIQMQRWLTQWFDLDGHRGMMMGS